MGLTRTEARELKVLAREYSDDELKRELGGMLSFGAPLESKLILYEELHERGISLKSVPRFL